MISTVSMWRLASSGHFLSIGPQTVRYASGPPFYTYFSPVTCILIIISTSTTTIIDVFVIIFESVSISTIYTENRPAKKSPEGMLTALNPDFSPNNSRNVNRNARYC